MAAMTLFPDDNALDDAELWAVIDSAVVSHSASKSNQSKTLALVGNPTNLRNLTPKTRTIPSISYQYQTPEAKGSRNSRFNYTVEEDPREGEVLQERSIPHRPRKIMRSDAYGGFQSPGSFNGGTQLVFIEKQPHSSPNSCKDDGKEIFCHSLNGGFPSVSLFKQYQNAAMAILEKSDYTVISGHPFIKKSGWRKISFFFNLSFEIKDKTIEYDQHQNVQRAEFVVRAYMQGGRFSDGWGSCERREKKFLKPNHDIPSTAETRAKNKSCQDLLGIGEYRPGAGNS
ncbi:uncharacterized protein LOC18436066 [Amborella trichopoda]|uniref:Uncharacterized protein n=1 Tax=Amborella trichopoda TaxID=13333 RepID=W1PL20_AMBTC|nr:uncharacterized protein LOC18436066 [Amborella trichopoda]ERN07830.1 hypothetical protein AMTR_s00012p00186350 [Amborella trichopoda]|eukprot:XP_006846155.1 uncharacterized protein LOC18436066 [Amborella trichopoda]